MRDPDIEFTYQLEEKFWWFQGMRSIAWSWIGALNPQSVLDAGCGTAFHVRWLRDKFNATPVAGVDLAEKALRFGHQRDPQACLARASVMQLPFRAASFDLLTCFDTLSEISLTRIPFALSEYYRVIRPGGYIFMREAALPWLYSSHDAELLTLTRFTLSLLVNLLSNAGFKVVRKSYANFFLFPLGATRRLLKRLGLFPGSDVRPLPSSLAFLEPLFLAALNREARLLKTSVSFPIGLSAMALARKPR